MMEFLITVLIVLGIAHLCVYIYSHFFDMNIRKESAAAVDTMKAAITNFITEKDNLQKIIQEKNHMIDRLNDQYANLVKMHNLTVYNLPNIFEKEAMKSLINGDGEKYNESISTLKDYYEKIKNLNYNDSGDEKFAD